MIGLSPREMSTPLPAWLYGGAGIDVPGVDRTGRWRGSRGLIIDLDDTLYPLQRYVRSGFGAVAAHCEHAFGLAAADALAVLTRCASRGEQQTAFQTLCREFSLSSDTVSVLVEVYRGHRPSIVLGQAALDMLRALRAGAWRLAILTNGLPRVQLRKVEALGLVHLVDHVIYADQVAPGGKPAPAAFVEALRRLGTRPDRTVCLGDDLRRDIVGARTSGLATIRLATTGFASASAIDADIVVQSLSDVPRAAVSLLEGVIRHAA